MRADAICPNSVPAHTLANQNGAAMRRNGHLLVGNYNSGPLLRIDIHDPSKIDRVELPEPLKGAEGFDLGDDQHLIAF